MFKLNSSIEEINENNDIVDKDVTLFFTYTSMSDKLYEINNNSNLRNDLADVLKSPEISKFFAAYMSQSAKTEDLDVAAIINDPSMSDFLEKALPCLYGVKDSNRKLIQNEDTYEEAKDADWLKSLCNFVTLILIHTEIGALKTINSNVASITSNDKKK